jgi:hypothetical protein
MRVRRRAIPTWDHAEIEEEYYCRRSKNEGVVPILRSAHVATEKEVQAKES